VHFLDEKVDSIPGGELGVLQRLGGRDDGFPVELK
jgi:hypothetical protein